MTIQLPVIQQPTHEVELPSCKETIIVRPFITKEEKILLMAALSEDTKEYLRAYKQLVSNCVLEWCDSYKKVGELPLSDLEYLMLQLRIISISDSVNLTFKGIEKTECETCKKPVELVVDLKEVKLSAPPDNNTIMIDDENGFTLKPLTVRDQELLVKSGISNKLKDSKDKDQIDVAIEGVFMTIALHIDSFFDSENNVKVKEEDLPSVKKWVEELPNHLFTKVENYISSSPTLEHKEKLTCSECGFEQDVTFRGLEDFFG